MHIKLHCTLAAERVVKDGDSVLFDIWAYAELVDGTSKFALSDEAYYYYHIVHMAKRVLQGGCGVQPFVDLRILEHKVEHRDEKRTALLECGASFKNIRFFKQNG